jgi:hypothetical protein
MKKVKKVTSRRRVTARRTTSRSSKPQVAFYRRIFIFGSLAVILAVVIAIPNRTLVRGAVEGAQITAGMYDQQTITLPQVPGAVTYNIYYKEQSETKFTNAVRNLPSTVTSYTISYLKANHTYVYRISAKNNLGKEIYWAPQQSFVASQSM